MAGLAVHQLENQARQAPGQAGGRAHERALLRRSVAGAGSATWPVCRLRLGGGRSAAEQAGVHGNHHQRPHRDAAAADGCEQAAAPAGGTGGRNLLGADCGAGRLYLIQAQRIDVGDVLGACALGLHQGERAGQPAAGREAAAVEGAGGGGRQAQQPAGAPGSALPLL